MLKNIVSIILCLHNVMSYILPIIPFPTPLLIDELVILISVGSPIVLLQFLSIASVYASSGFKFLLLENACCAIAEVSIRSCLKLATCSFILADFGRPLFPMNDSPHSHFIQEHILFTFWIVKKSRKWTHHKHFFSSNTS